MREILLSPSSSPDQLVVMIKHERDFNPKANGWEFHKVNGDMTKVIKRGKTGDGLMFMIVMISSFRKKSDSNADPNELVGNGSGIVRLGQIWQAPRVQQAPV